MKRLWRTSITVSAAVSSLLFMAAVVLWVRSFWVMDEVIWEPARGNGFIWTAKGSLAGSFFVTSRRNSGPSTGLKYRRDQATLPFNFLLLMSIDPSDRQRDWHRGGFAGYSRRDGRNGDLYAILIVPFWFVATSAAAIPLMWLGRRWRHRRPRAGLCPSCGYDLRATPFRCPECGMNVVNTQTP